MRKTLPTNRIYGLDIVRAMAILLILISHSAILIAPDDEGLIVTAIKLGGTLGVDIFFVLSGWLIGGILLKLLEQGKTSWVNLRYFWIRRWFRTLPNYYLILLINIALDVWVFGFIPDQVWRYFVFLQNFGGAMPDFFTESWSLTIEEFSYLIGPFLLYVLVWFSPKHFKQHFLSVTLIIIATFIGFKAYHFLNIPNLEYAQWSAGLRKTLIYRLDSVYYGFLGIYLYREVSWFKMRRKMLFALGWLLFLTMHAAILISDMTVINSPLFFDILYLPLISIAVMLWMPLMTAIRDGKGILHKGLTQISLISYSLYLVNYSIVLLLLREYAGDWNALALLGIFWGLSLGLAYILYYGFELPVMRFRESGIFKKQSD